MAVTAEDLQKFEEDNKVLVVYNKGDKTIEAEGTLRSVTDLAILLKLKGRTNSELIEVDEIEDIQFAPEKAKELKAKTLTPVKFGSVRQHLLDRHGYTLEQVNAMTEEDAFELHRSIDHKAQELGHVHGNKLDNEVAA